MNKIHYLIISIIFTFLVQLETLNQAQTNSNIQFQPPNTQSSVLVDFVAAQEQTWKNDYESHLGSNFANAHESNLGTNLTPDMMNAQAIRHTLQRMEKETGKKSAVIYLIPEEKQLQIILVTPNQEVIQKQIPAANQNMLLKIARQFQTEIKDARKVDTRSYLAPAQQLYRWLIAPIEPELQAQNIDTLLFCVGAGLRSVPFSALHNGQKFLVEKYSASLIPAFSLTDTRYTDIRNFSVLAMGASQFQNLEPLPAVPVELSTIVKNQGGSDFLNEKFTVDNLRSQRQKQSYKIIHLATHGVFTSGAISNSYIQFWNTKLRLNELHNLQLNTPTVDLLVLSACKTALGDQDAELGFSGLALQAGVKSAMGSLWSVSDAGTLGLMTEFYSQLNISTIKAEALRKAQIEMLNGRIRIKQGKLQQLRLKTETSLPVEIAKLGDFELSHPYYWAGFTMIGSPW